MKGRYVGQAMVPLENHRECVGVADLQFMHNALVAER
jgi:hypothetical protein